MNKKTLMLAAALVLGAAATANAATPAATATAKPAKPHVAKTHAVHHATAAAKPKADKTN